MTRYEHTDDPEGGHITPVDHGNGLVVIRYINGVDRNNENAVKSHIYAMDNDGDLWPMCEYGWNRSGGERFSILRGWVSKKGHCAICTRRAEKNLPPISQARGHKTKWL